MQWRIQGREPPLFLHQTEAPGAKKNLGETAAPSPFPQWIEWRYSLVEAVIWTVSNINMGVRVLWWPSFTFFNFTSGFGGPVLDD